MTMASTLVWPSTLIEHGTCAVHYQFLLLAVIYKLDSQFRNNLSRSYIHKCGFKGFQKLLINTHPLIYYASFDL